MDLSKLFPYVVPKPYVDRIKDAPPGFVIPIGNDVSAMLVLDHGSHCSNVNPAELQQAGLTIPEAHSRALSNLEDLAAGPTFQRFQNDADGLPFLIWEGHWLAASCIRLGGLFKFATEALKSDAVFVSIPQREVMFLFPPEPVEKRNALCRTIRENEKSAAKLVTWNLFKISQAGVEAAGQ